ncbi:MAG: methylated-DNA--[protein]-cysteine S-methyltransferase [Verrucomicrobia bacterium]|nr:methylated-DNA--[protein]-cysteine S-methyltransferase [Verrucomicrobiota bacterium]
MDGGRAGSGTGDCPDRAVEHRGGGVDLRRDGQGGARAARRGEARLPRQLDDARAICRARCRADKPWPITLSCDRVIASDGTLGGCSAGLRRKRALLALQGDE